MNGHDIVQTSNEKDFGAIIDDLMKFHLYTQFVVSKANCTLGRSHSLTFQRKHLHFYTQIEYGNVNWGPFCSLGTRIKLNKFKEGPQNWFHV